jgi:hypothetical protein
VSSFTVDEAFALAPTLRQAADELIDVRAELVERRAGSRPGPLAEVKALEARLADLLDQLAAKGLQVKGWAPLLVDVPVALEDRVVLFCWLEGDEDLAWYHELEHGFAGRRPISRLDL